MVDASALSVRPKKKKKLCLRLPNRPYFFGPTLKNFLGFQKKKKKSDPEGVCSAVISTQTSPSTSPVVKRLSKTSKTLRGKKKNKNKKSDLPTLFFLAMLP